MGLRLASGDDPSELTGLKFGDYCRLRAYDNNVGADKRGHLDWARPVVPGVRRGQRGQMARLLIQIAHFLTHFVCTVFFSSQ